MGNVRGHYERLAADFDGAWSFSPQFLSWMTDQILDRLAPHGRTVELAIDIGCGPGLYARGLAQRAHRVVCLDQLPEMLDQLPAEPVYAPVRASVEELVAGRVQLPHNQFDAILVKDLIHHIADKAAAIAALADLLRPNGRLLVVMLPTRVGYPLFDAALRRFEELQPDPADIATMMRAAGLTTELAYDDFGLSFPRERYLGMVADRYLSILSDFDDAELAAGIDEMTRRYPSGAFEFVDRLAFLTGIRP
ncbi:class I SAM-dependent methyltransferase [Nocardia altamirensis]|uniref:class I SAM-dependent methyltransferase n=1 Tax=Nocardia altamirensis TaxID=472158 RepID=UPI00084015BE|nr:methyltransferase domain-containing protein [Nocardia altamirensis]